MLRSLWSVLCTFVGTVLLLFALLTFIIPAARILPALILYRNDHPAKGADAIVLFMGDPVDRVPHVANLYKRGYASKIVLVESEGSKLVDLGLKPLDGQIAYDYLTKIFHIPATDIIFNDKSRVTSTLEESRALLRAIDENKLRNIILATSWYHSSRVHWTFAKLKTNHLSLESYPSPIPSKWYQKESEFLNVFNEYIKWPYNYVRFEVLN